MANNYFRFKQFEVNQSQSAMKVGTDGVLLGAWCRIPPVCRRALDIGCGTGVIALMLAQRTDSVHIDAVDVDEDAFVQSRENFAASPWSNRIESYCTTIQQFAEVQRNRYELIVSNPPYFINSLKAPDAARMAARHTALLPYADLAQSVSRLLTPEGIFCGVFPYREGNIFIAEAALFGLFCTVRCEVHSVADKPVKRLLLEFSRQRSVSPVVEHIAIEQADNQGYTEEYKKLTGEFYLKF